MQEMIAGAARRPWTAAAQAVAVLALVFATGAVGNAVTLPQIPGWYASLAKPAFNPPNWVFGPAWTTLYLLLAFATWRILQKPADTPGRSVALAAFGVNLVFNALWSIVFFGLQNPPLALVVVVALLLSVLSVIVTYRRVDPLSGWLNVPYALWVSFATALNIAIVWLN